MLKSTHEERGTVAGLATLSHELDEEHPDGTCDGSLASIGLTKYLYQIQDVSRTVLVQGATQTTCLLTRTDLLPRQSANDFH